MPCYSPLHGWQDPITGGWISRPGGIAHTKMAVKCGQCLGCRLDRAQSWQIRQVHESTEHTHNRFVTLTYRPKSTCTDKQIEKGQHLPNDGSIHKQHFQKFLKKLRHHVPKFSYYACGEYGDGNGRPHYHANFFGLSFPDETLIQRTENGALFYSEMLEKIWGYGFCTTAEFTYQTAGYVSRYVLKKVTGNLSHDKYLRFDDYGNAYWVEPESQWYSCKPALGKKWWEKYVTDCYPANVTPVPGENIVLNGTPTYYDYLLKKCGDADLLQITKKARMDFMARNGADYTTERLIAKYKVKKAQIRTLQRNL